MARIRNAERSTSASVILVACIAVILFLGKVLLVPLAFALTLSFLLGPVVAWLERRRMPRTVAVALVSALTCAGVLLVFYVVFSQVLHIAETLPQYRENIERRINVLHSPAEGSITKAFETLEELGGEVFSSGAAPATDALPVRIVDGKTTQLAAAGLLMKRVFQPLGEFAIVLVFAMYMLVNREELRHRLLLLAGMGRINLMTRALDDATVRISQYLVMQFEVNACYGVLFGCGLFAIGVPEATLWGVIAGVLRIIPYLGTTVGMVLPLILSIAVSTSWWPPVLVVAWFVVLEATAANFVEPWLFSSRTGISSLALLASAIFWTMLWGWPGLVLSTPLTVCVVVIGRHVPQLGFLHSLLGTNAQLSPAAYFYERLLANDQREARAITERFLDEGRSLVELYDTVLVPALSLTEEERHQGALDAVRSNFIFLSVGELVALLSEHDEAGAPKREKSARTLLMESLKPKPKKEFAVVCISAGDRADEMTTQMLTQLLERANYQTLSIAAAALAPEILRGMAAERDTVIFVSALPPFAFAEVRAICQRIRTLMPENRIAVGLWNTTEDNDEMLARFGAAQPDVVLGSLAAALRQVDGWRHRH